MTKTIEGFIIIKDDEINTGTFNRVRHVAKARMVTLSKIDWPELENAGYSVRECEATFECSDDAVEILGNGGEPIIERNEDPVRDDK